MQDVLQQVLEKLGVDPRAAAVLSSLQAKKRGRKTEISWRDPAIAEKFAEERAIREALRRLQEPAALLSVRFAPISATKTVAEVRSGDTVVLWFFSERTARRKPRTKRMLAQNLPSVKVKTVDVERIVVSSPEHLMTVPLRLPGRNQRIRLPESERKFVLNPPSMWWLRFQGGSATLAIAGDVTEIRAWLKKVRERYPLGKRLEISHDEKHWTPLTNLFLP